jgi:hypothetical protein
MNAPSVLGIILLFLQHEIKAQFNYKSTYSYPASLNYTLSRLPASISHIEECSTINPNASLQVFAISRNWCFGHLQMDQFNDLARAYSNWWNGLDFIQFDPQRSYSLIDFLHPAMQATNRHEFTPIFAEIAAPDYRKNRAKDCGLQNSLLTSNCWGFAYSVLYSIQSREFKKHTLSAGDAQAAWKIFTDDRYSVSLQKAESAEQEVLKDFKMRNQKLEQGDYVLFWHKNKPEENAYLDHVAIFIDDDVYYERAGAGDHVPFRLNDWKSILDSWMPGVFKIEWRRITGKLDSVEQVFGMHSKETLNMVPDAAHSPDNLANQFSLDLDIEKGQISSQTYVRIYDIQFGVDSKDYNRPVYFLPDTLYVQDTYLNDWDKKYCNDSLNNKQIII